MGTSVTLDKAAMATVLYRLANLNGRARQLYARLMTSWGMRPDRQCVTVKLADPDLDVLRSLNLPRGTLTRSVVTSGWVVVYRHQNNPDLEVRVTTRTKPPKRRTFTVGGKKRRLVAVKVTRIKPKEAVPNMARKKKAAVEEDEIDELEGLEELDDLDDEELDEDEPEDEEEEDEDEEEEEPAPKRRAKKAPAKKAPAKKSTSRKRAPVEEEEDDEDEEDEEPAPKKRSTSTKAKAAGTKAATKTKAKSSGNGNLPAQRELPKGKVGPREIAELVGGDCDDRYVRIFLRDNDYERPEGGRWAFGKQEARTVAKAIKAKRRSE